MSFLTEVELTKEFEMTVTLLHATTDQELRDVAAMATSIWHEYWPALLTEEQIDYMVDTMQSFEPIKHAIETEGYRYWFILDEEKKRVGYTAARLDQSTNRLFISKIYLYKEDRGKHYATQVLCFYESLCQEEGLSSMYLTVNKHNELGCRAYTGRGFATIDSVQTDIGHGFIMDDFIMEKQIF
ncbi:MAG: GNAT family N-acetyltransferase [Raoultibacter sp.]